MHPQVRKLILGSFVIAAIASCYAGKPEEIVQSDVVITVRNEGIEFSTHRTWAMADTVWPIMYTKADTVTDIHDSMILEEVTNAMVIYGYERILDPSPENPPDVYVTVANMSTVFGFWDGPIIVEEYCDWWAYCDTCCAAGWLPDYPPGYPSGVFPIGTLFIDMYKPALIDAEEGSLPVIWTAVANGVIEFNEAHARENTKSAIRRAFAQSPYLDVN